MFSQFEYTKNHFKSKTLRYTTHMSRTKIGFFGGTFDPPHLGHLILASEAAQQFELDRLLWVLTPDPPHKLNQKITPFEHRLEMLQSMIAKNPVFELSRLDIDRPGPHYAIDAVRLLIEQEPEADIHLLMGGDSLNDLPNWRLSTDLIAAVSKIGVMPRPGSIFNLPTLEEKLPGLSNKLVWIDALVNAVSSRELRGRIAKKGVYRYYFPSVVYEYIEKHNLYHEIL